MIGSVHLADVGARRTLRLLRATPPPGAVPGLRVAHLVPVGPLAGSAVPKPALRRAGLIALWDDEAALERFLDGHPLAREFAGGWHARLDPLRKHGSWPGLDQDIPASRATEYTGPAAVLTLGRLRGSQTVRFLRTGAKAQAAALASPGLIWGAGMGRPGLVATFSLWESTRALSAYAYGQALPAHTRAIAEEQARPFHHESAFVRFRPTLVSGALGGDHPLDAAMLAGWPGVDAPPAVTG